MGDGLEDDVVLGGIINMVHIIKTVEISSRTSSRQITFDNAVKRHTNRQV